MFTAALDTSSQIASFTVEDSDSGRIVYSNHSISIGKDSSRLALTIANDLETVGIDLSQIRNWIVGTGPGSYTGIRVGIAFVQGVCDVTGARLAGYPSSLAMGFQAAGGDGECIAILHDARCESLILSLLTATADGLMEKSPPEIVKISDVENHPADRYVILDHDRARSSLTAVKISLQVLDYIDSGKLIAIHRSKKLSEGAKTEDGLGLKPVYVRPPVFVKPVRMRSVTGVS